MKAIILCGGRGTRLREQTDVRPKPMVEIGGRPILWHIMKFYAHYGITEFILCLGYKGYVIKEYFLNYGAMNSDFTVHLGEKKDIQYHARAHSEDGWKVTLVDTGEDTMTGARVLRASRYLDDNPSTFCVTYGDGVADLNLRAALAFHRSHGRLATVTGVRPLSRFGELTIGGDRVVAFSEKPQMGTGMINGGFFLFEPDFLQHLSDDPACGLERAPMETCATAGQLYVYEHKGFWQCMDTFRDLQVLEGLWQDGNAPWKVWE